MDIQNFAPNRTSSSDSSLDLPENAVFDQGRIRGPVVKSELKERVHTARLQNLSASVNALPVELLVHIFTAAESLYYYEIPVIGLSQVCFYWRQVVHSTPRLWSFFSFTVDETPSELSIAGAKAWLDRSAQLPLAISLHSYEHADLTAVVDTLLPFQTRLASLELLLDSYLPLTRLFAQPLGRLENLRLYGKRLPSESEQIDLSTMAPLLRHVFLHEDYSHFFKVPWAQLTHLTLQDGPDACLNVLRECQNLEMADLETWQWMDAEDIIHQPSFILPRLKTLRVATDLYTKEKTHITPFFEPLALPALEHLKLSFETQPTDWSESQFSAFQLRAPHLSHLILDHCAIDSEALLAILRASPALESLSICTMCAKDTVLQALCYQPGIEPLVPLLHNLHWTQSFDARSLEAMLRSRRLPDEFSQPVACLDSVFIGCCVMHNYCNGIHFER
ncbi:hypothetical protein C8J57DRAFT_661703 [Mycena rebaudengoi]|nr:hypothetical protein C8J57DRAFT_661703 [Mycena rebaudengoi]